MGEKGHLGHAANTAFAGVDTLLGLWWQTAVSGAHFLGVAEGAQVVRHPEMAAHTPQLGTVPCPVFPVQFSIEVVYSRSAIKPELFSSKVPPPFPNLWE